MALTRKPVTCPCPPGTYFPGEKSWMTSTIVPTRTSDPSNLEIAPLYIVYFHNNLLRSALFFAPRNFFLHFAPQKQICCIFGIPGMSSITSRLTRGAVPFTISSPGIMFEHEVHLICMAPLLFSTGGDTDALSLPRGNLSSPACIAKLRN